MIIVDGNDGTGKSTLVNQLRKLGLFVNDRGIPTKMTDDESLYPEDNGDLYIILDCDVATSQQRLLNAGKDINEKYHTIEDLTYYRQKYIEVTKRLPKNKQITICSDVSEQMVLKQALDFLKKNGIIII